MITLTVLGVISYFVWRRWLRPMAVSIGCLAPEADPPNSDNENHKKQDS